MERKYRGGGGGGGGVIVVVVAQGNLINPKEDRKGT